MLNRPTDNQLLAMHKLNNNKEYQEICQWLKTSLQNIRRQNDVEENDARFRQNQGACRTLQSFLDITADAFNLLRERQTTRKADIEAFV